MADNVSITAGTGTSIAADEVIDTDLGTVKVQYVKLMDGALDGTSKASVGANGLVVDGSGVTHPVSAASLPLPTGAATSSKQDTGNTSLASIDGKITAVNTGAVTVSSSALPTGAATSAKQPALGTAGTPSSDVMTVQGKTSMTPILTDGSATTQPVSGTVSVSGVSTASKQDTGNTSLSSIDGKITAVNTGAVVISSSALPSGASTSAKQPALGTAGTPSSDVLTVQGKSGMTALTVDGSGTTQPVSGTVAANAGTNLNTSALALESGGNLATLAGGVSSSKYQTNLAQLAGNTISSGVGTSSTGTLRTVIANDTGRTLLSAGGSASSSGNNTLVAAGTSRLKVFAFTLSTTSTTAMTCIFQSGASGTELWRVVLQAPTSVSTGANLVVQPPAWLFATASATLLNLNLSSANAVHWSVSYWDEA